MALNTSTPRVRLVYANALRLDRWSFERNSAPHWRLYWNRTPGASVELDGAKTHLHSRVLVLIPPETPFSSTTGRIVEHLYLHFLLEPSGATKPFILALTAARETRAQASLLMDGFLDGSAATPSSLMRSMALIHGALARAPAEWLAPVRMDPRIEAAVRRIETDCATGLRNDDLARQAGMNTNAFIRLFGRETGTTPQEYAARKRIERACVMLYSQTMTIKAIAEATGFCDRYHFTRVFTRLRGVPPASFRRQVCRPS